MPFIGNQPTQGRFIELDSLTASATANYTLQLNSANFEPESVNNLLVSINGVIQGSSTMSLNGAVLTVGATLSSSDTIDFVRVFGNVGTVSTPTDGSVTANKIGSGAVTSAKIADGTIVNADINASAGIDGSKLGTDAVLQVKQGVQATPFTISTTEADIMSVQITPKSTSSKILVTINLMAAHADSHSGVARLFRDSTVVGGGAGDNPGSNALEGNIFTIRTLSIHNIDSMNMTYLDTPNSSSQLTYTLKGKSTGTANGLYINRTINTSNVEYNSSVMSTITVQEIGG